jgi:hypothetical protein
MLPPGTHQIPPQRNSGRNSGLLATSATSSFERLLASCGIPNTGGRLQYDIFIPVVLWGERRVDQQEVLHLHIGTVRGIMSLQNIVQRLGDHYPTVDWYVNIAHRLPGH